MLHFKLLKNNQTINTDKVTIPKLNDVDWNLYDWKRKVSQKTVTDDCNTQTLPPLRYVTLRSSLQRCSLRHKYVASRIIATITTHYTLIWVPQSSRDACSACWPTPTLLLHPLYLAVSEVRGNRPLFVSSVNRISFIVVEDQNSNWWYFYVWYIDKWKWFNSKLFQPVLTLCELWKHKHIYIILLYPFQRCTVWPSIYEKSLWSGFVQHFGAVTKPFVPPKNGELL